MRYRVDIPKPKAERMDDQPRTLKISWSSGWSGFGGKRQYTIQPIIETFEFEMMDNYESATDTDAIDGRAFWVKIEFSNQDGSRTEVVDLVPQKVD